MTQRPILVRERHPSLSMYALSPTIGPRHCDIYAKELSSLFRGHAVHNPRRPKLGSGLGLRPPVDVGDVVYDLDGQIIRLFNCLIPIEAQDADCRFPDDFEVLESYDSSDDGSRPVSITIVEGHHRPGPFYSKGVRMIEVEAGISVSPAGSARIAFSTRDEQGAVLLTAERVTSRKSPNRPSFEKYMIKNYDSWCALLVSQLLDVRPEHLMLVTSVERTQAWSNVVFANSQLDGAFNVDIPPISVVEGKLSVGAEFSRTRSATRDSGPNPEDLVCGLGDGETHECDSSPHVARDDQLIFIRGLRGKRRRFFGLKVLQAGAEPSDTGRSDRDSSSDGGSPGLSIEDIGGSQSREDYLAPVLDFVLENSDVDMAIAHDDDYHAFCQHKHYTSSPESAIKQDTQNCLTIGTLVQLVGKPEDVALPYTPTAISSSDGDRERVLIERSDYQFWASSPLQVYADSIWLAPERPPQISHTDSAPVLPQSSPGRARLIGEELLASFASRSRTLARATLEHVKSPIVGATADNDSDIDDIPDLSHVLRAVVPRVAGPDLPEAAPPYDHSSIGTHELDEDNEAGPSKCKRAADDDDSDNHVGKRLKTVASASRSVGEVWDDRPHNPFFPVALDAADLRLPATALNAGPPAFVADAAAITAKIAVLLSVPTPKRTTEAAAGPPFGHSVECDDDISDASDSSSDVTELDIEEFPSYFAEHNGRLFHHSGISSSYIFPVDETELKRSDATHKVLTRVLNSYYDGPVEEVLSQDASTKSVIDMCTGTGLWVMDMAREFPRVQFRGFDKVPIMTRYPLENVHFEIGDVREHLRIADASVDIVHARMTGLSIVDYVSLLRQAARILRPGGLFIAAEWGAYPALHPSHPAASHPATELPNTTRFYEALNERVNYGATALALALPTLINTTHAFNSACVRPRAFPIGSPLPGVEPAVVLCNIGEIMQRCLHGFVDAAIAGHPALAEHGKLVKHEVDTTLGMVSVLHTVYARKL